MYLMGLESVKDNDTGAEMDARRVNVEDDGSGLVGEKKMG